MTAVFLKKSRRLSFPSLLLLDGMIHLSYDLGLIRAHPGIKWAQISFLFDPAAAGSDGN
jgi:hypothetical protein